MWMTLFAVFKVKHPGHVIVDDRDDIRAGIEFTIEDMISDAGDISLNSRITCNNVCAWIGGAIGGDLIRIDVNSTGGVIFQRHDSRAAI